MTDLSPETWTSSSNDALEVVIAEKEGSFSFHPIFTYPIFGDSETIFGYKDLKIKLTLDSFTVLPLLQVTYDSILPNVELEDPEAKLLEFLPKETVLKDELAWTDRVTSDHTEFQIPGEVIHSYKNENDTYKVYKATLADPQALKLHLRLQILVLLFIEAGSYIDETDKMWDIYLLYKHSPDQPPSIVGFCTAYNYFLYQGHEEHDQSLNFSYRKKISQFIILPTYQGQRHGQKLYNAMFDLWFADDHIKEICVEDPNESFDDLRDRCDLMRLSRDKLLIKELIDLKLPYSSDWFNEKKSQLKVEKRQLQRLFEMLLIKLNLVKQISNKKPIRLQVKKRLYWKNKDSLIELDQPTAMDKLQTAFEGLEQDYIRIMGSLDLDLSNKRSLDDA